LTDAQSFVLPVDKPPGPTSHDVVAQARRALGNRRIGHTGTLDPFASGLLLLCVGSATRIAEFLTNLPKTYRATARLDGHTPTDDNTTEVVDASEAWRALTRAQVDAALQTQVGEIMQLPPQYSAKKIAGERAYDIARRGDVATLTAVPVHIFRITLLEVQLPDIEFEVECASGTYIRAIARDVGAELGTGGYLTELRRTAVGDSRVDDAVPLADLNDRNKVIAASRTPAAALSHLPGIEVTEEQERAIRFGQSLAPDAGLSGTIKLVRGGQLVAIADADSRRIKPRKVIGNA
jgi:tRNA pseudouridine55 synthase